MTSKDTMISSGSIVCWRMKVENDFELLVCCSFVYHTVLVFLQYISILHRAEFLCMTL